MPPELKPTEFSSSEVRRVLRRYDLGEITAAVPMQAGSAHSPKLLVTTDRNVYLLKRRAPNKSDPFKVAFSHEIQLFLAKHHFPVPHLIATCDDNNTLVQTEEAVYEVFEFLQSTAYDRSTEATASAGRTLALSHKLLALCRPSFPPPTGGYHDHPHIPKLLRRAEAVVGASPGKTSGRTLFQEVFSLRDRVRRAANAAGLRTWPKQIVHADYHPGNVLFHDHHVVGVIDFDGARIQQCILDLANSVTTFSTFIDPSVAPADWPIEVELPRFSAFITAYDAAVRLSEAEVEVLPLLMVEAVLTECTMLLAGAGADEITKSLPWLEMALARGRWIERNADMLRSQLG
jgi:Ser/Thr protein kinase RdoA (MazF antagonist)